MRHKHESGAWFELPEDLTWSQLETYEETAQEKLEGARRTDARLARASIEAAFTAGFVTAGEGCPTSAEALKEFKSSRVMYWMAAEISMFVARIKTVDPKSSGRQR